jgi:hypothetical protein
MDFNHLIDEVIKIFFNKKFFSSYSRMRRPIIITPPLTSGDWVVPPHSFKVSLGTELSVYLSFNI